MKDYSIGESLRKVRKEHNLKQKDIAEAIGIDRSTYSFYETGKTNPPIETMCALAKIYNVTIGYLIGKEANNPELRVRANAVSSAVDPIALLNEDEQKLIIYYRLAQENSKKEILDEVIRKCRNDAENKDAEG
ncbi:MAG: helix-turn-helix transcriptional regulator [Clostridia bacterium]|nr:helix-turn-helix transcriptional regulator [Clostridia bacterium]